MTVLFKKMINMYSTYCVGISDPIEDNFEELVEGIRTFNEKFNLDVFSQDYIESIAKCKPSDT